MPRFQLNAKVRFCARGSRIRYANKVRLKTNTSPNLAVGAAQASPRPALLIISSLMSRQPSPGPSHNPNHGHFFQAAVPLPTPPVRQKSKAYSSGIAAGAEDVKYAAKYRDLKRKVKEIEGVSRHSVLPVLYAG